MLLIVKCWHSPQQHYPSPPTNERTKTGNVLPSPELYCACLLRTECHWKTPLQHNAFRTTSSTTTTIGCPGNGDTLSQSRASGWKIIIGPPRQSRMMVVVTVSGFYLFFAAAVCVPGDTEQRNNKHGHETARVQPAGRSGYRHQQGDGSEPDGRQVSSDARAKTAKPGRTGGSTLDGGMKIKWKLFSHSPKLIKVVPGISRTGSASNASNQRVSGGKGQKKSDDWKHIRNRAAATLR